MDDQASLRPIKPRESAALFTRKWPRPPQDTRSLKELNERLEEVGDELEDLRSEQKELEARIEELELVAHDEGLATRAKQLLDDSHTEYLCWPEISALEDLLVSPTIALINRVRQILSNHCRLYS